MPSVRFRSWPWSACLEHRVIPPLHLLRRYPLDAVADQPPVPPGVEHAAAALAVERIRGLPLQLRARRDRLRDQRIGIVHVDVQRDWRAALRPEHAVLGVLIR